MGIIYIFNKKHNMVRFGIFITGFMLCIVNLWKSVKISLWCYFFSINALNAGWMLYILMKRKCTGQCQSVTLCRATTAQINNTDFSGVIIMTQILTQNIENNNLIMTQSQLLSGKIMTSGNFVDYFSTKT